MEKLGKIKKVGNIILLDSRSVLESFQRPITNVTTNSYILEIITRYLEF